MGSASFKCVAAIKNLKNANKICNLEAMVSSKANAEILEALAMEHAGKRELFFRNIKLHLDRQNKHILGKHNYETGKSVFEHKDSERLFAIYAGKGRKMNNKIPGTPGYKEVVDFEQEIGLWKTKENNISLKTT